MDTWVDGGLSLQKQEDTLGGTESEKFLKLVKYEKGDEFTKPDGTKVKRNFPTFEDDDSEADLPELRLVVVPSNKTTASVIATEEAKGRKKIFVSKVYVKNSETKIVAFREADKK